MNNDYDIDIPLKEEIVARINKNNKLKKKVKKKKVNKLIIRGLFLILLIVFGVSLIEINKWLLDNKETKAITKETESLTEIEEINEDSNLTNIELINEASVAPKSDYWYYVTFPLIQVDFNELLKKNSDTVAWIQVNNTNINYPVVKTNNNDYYLKHSYDKSYNDAGWVFMDYRNSGTLNDKNTILYAHSRLDKTMFGSLSKVFKNEWYKNKDNHIIKMSTKEENSLWQIFSVYHIEVEDYYIKTDFSTKSEYLEFLKTLKSRSKFKFDATLSEDDAILTLSTCYSDTERTVVHAKKIKKSLRDS